MSLDNSERATLPMRGTALAVKSIPRYLEAGRTGFLPIENCIVKVTSSDHFEEFTCKRRTLWCAYLRRVAEVD